MAETETDMSSTSFEVKSLWPVDLNVQVRAPKVILATQAQLLAKITKGILTAAVESEESGSTKQLRLVVIVPAANFRHTLLTVTHDIELPYPAEIQGDSSVTEPFEVSDDAELISGLRMVLNSTTVRAALASMIARANDADTL